MLLRAVAACPNLTSFELSIVKCVPACDRAFLMEIFEDNTTLQFFSLNESQGEVERLREITDRNIFWQKQQRFKTVKLAKQ